MTIRNPDNIPEEIVRAAIAMMEQEEGRKVVEISIRRTGNPDEFGITPVLSGCRSNVSAGSPATWWETWAGSTMPSVRRWRTG